MTEPKIAKKSIAKRLRLVNFLTLISFFLIAVTLVVSFIKVRGQIDQVVQNQLKQTAENSEVSRELAEFLSRLQLLGSTFFGHDSYLEVEGAELQRRLVHLNEKASNPQLKQHLLAMQGQLSRYLNNCQEVNNLILWRSYLDEDIDDALKLLGELVAERMIEVTLQNGDIEYLEQLVMLLSGYRESLLEIAVKNAAENYQQLLVSKASEPPPRSAEIAGLSLRLRTLTASEPPIDRLGRHLIDQLAYYQHLMRLYQLEMILLGEETAALDALTTRSLAEMAQIDLESTQVAQRVSEQIVRNVAIGGLTVLGLLLVLGCLLGLTHHNLFVRHIRRPMEIIVQRLQSFRDGDFSTPMQLQRDDEWGQIEAGFNAMLGDLVKSWSDLQASEQRYRDIFDNASEGIYQSTLEGQYLNINPALAETLGFASPQDAIAALTDLREQIYPLPEDRDRLVEQIREEGMVKGFETRLRRQSGEIFWASVNGHLVEDDTNNRVFLEGTINDISVRRAAEESLQKLRAFLQNIVDSMPSIMIGVDADCRVTLWNQQAEIQTGVGSEQARGQMLAEVFPLIDAYLFLPQVTEALRNQQQNRLRKVPGQQEQSTSYDILVFPLSAGEPAGAVIHIEDVTERSQIEEVIVQSEKMLSVGGLAAGMAHEINNPLAAILQNAQVLGRRLSPVLEKNRQVADELGIDIEQIAEYARLRGVEQMLQAITASGQRAARIVENMLAFSSKRSLDFIPHSLVDLVERALELAASDFDLKQNYDFRSIRIRREFAPMPDVPCEASQIQQVLLNLLKNAAQALKDQPEPQVTLRISSSPTEVCLQIEDNGVGMDEETRKRVFEPFFTTKDVGSGTGLGLSVSYFIIAETHKGGLTVSSKPGQGSSFSIVLPLGNREEH